MSITTSLLALLAQRSNGHLPIKKNPKIVFEVTMRIDSNTPAISQETLGVILSELLFNFQSQYGRHSRLFTRFIYTLLNLLFAFG